MRTIKSIWQTLLYLEWQRLNLDPITIYQRRQWQLIPVLLPGKSQGWRSLVGCVHGVAKSRARLSEFTFTFHFHAMEKEMATHFSVLAWRIPGMGEPGGLPSMGSHRVGHDWSDLAVAAAQGDFSSLVCFSVCFQICSYMHVCVGGVRVQVEGNSWDFLVPSSEFAEFDRSFRNMPVVVFPTPRCFRRGELVYSAA